MIRECMYDDDSDDDILEDLEDIRRACMVSEAKSAFGGGVPSDSEDEEDFETLRSIKIQLASTDADLCGRGLPERPSDSEKEEDFETLRSIKIQLASTDADLCGTGLPERPSDSESEDDFEMLRNIKSQLAQSMDEDEDGVSASDTIGAIRRRFSAYEKIGNFMNDGSSLSRCNSFEKSVQVEEAVDLQEKASAASSSFPESAQAFVDAIRKNRSYQAFLRKKLTEIEALIEQNDKHKKNVVIVKRFQAFCKKKKKDPPILQLISTKGNVKKTSSPLTLGPPENLCVANYRTALEKYHPVSVDREDWTTEEKEDLAKGLKQQLQDTIIREAFERSSDDDDTDIILEAVKNLEITPEMIRQFLPKVKWDQLDIKNRCAAECEARWMSCEDPLINKSPWTEAEDNYIRSIMIQNKTQDWLDVAVSLGTNRTPFQCLVRYQRSLNPEMLNREWSAEEDEQLRTAVDLLGVKNWQAVANLLQSRNGPQCSNRWRKTLQPSIGKKGRWSSEEDKRLKIAVTFFGANNWPNIAKFVPGRNQVQCRERWVNAFDPKINFGKWSDEEDAKLREAIREHGHCWSKVALQLCCRTDNQCLRRWKSLYPHLVAPKQEARKLKREATLGNFVDRESERPTLVAPDFLEISLEPEQQQEQQLTLQKKKRKARQRKSDTTEREPRRKRLEICSERGPENETVDGGEVRCLEWPHKQDSNVKEKSVAEETSSSNITTQLPPSQKKLKPRMKVSGVVTTEPLSVQTRAKSNIKNIENKININ